MSKSLSKQKEPLKIATLEVYSEIYTSISLTQETLKASLGNHFLKEQIPEIVSVIDNPRILLIKHEDHVSSDDLASLLGHDAEKGWHSISKDFVENCKRWTCPFAVVVFLSASGGHGSCRLSRFDIDILDEIKNNFQDFRHITFIIKYSRHSVNYTSKDLDRLSEEIKFELYGTNHRNKIFCNTFLSNDNQISIRLGLRMHKSIQGQLLNAQKYSQNLVNEMNNQLKRFQKKRNKITKSLSKIIHSKDSQCCSRVSRKTNHIIFEQIAIGVSKLFRLEQMKQLKSLLTTGEVKQCIKKHLVAVIDAKSKHDKNRIHRKHTRTGSRIEPLHSMASHSCKTKSTKRFSNFVVIKASELICSDIYNIICSRVEEQEVKIIFFCNLLEDECSNNRLHGVAMHELKILAYRHDKVSGFGYIDGAVCVYIKGSDEEDKKEILKFFEKYVDTTKYDFKIKFRKKKEIALFSKLENGSRINKFETTGNGPHGYGTLGMFLEDRSGTYFFTTCAHVIEKNAIAYFPDDNTKIGENVFVCHPNTNNSIKHAQTMDFSLIKVCPDSDIECKLGLKSVNGNFIKGAIFKGDISELLGRRLYKWGATEPHLQTGKCTGIEEEEFIYIQINSENFAKPGDSGAIICAGTDNNTALAAFVLVGEWTERKTTYVVYKIADALDIVAKMTEEMKPCLSTKSFTVVSASNNGSSARA